MEKEEITKEINQIKNIPNNENDTEATIENSPNCYNKSKYKIPDDMIDMENDRKLFKEFPNTLNEDDKTIDLENYETNDVNQKERFFVIDEEQIESENYIKIQSNEVNLINYRFENNTNEKIQQNNDLIEKELGLDYNQIQNSLSKIKEDTKENIENSEFDSLRNKNKIDFQSNNNKKIPNELIEGENSMNPYLLNFQKNSNTNLNNDFSEITYENSFENLKKMNESEREKEKEKEENDNYSSSSNTDVRNFSFRPYNVTFTDNNSLRVKGENPNQNENNKEKKKNEENLTNNSNDDSSMIKFIVRNKQTIKTENKENIGEKNFFPLEKINDNETNNLTKSPNFENFIQNNENNKKDTNITKKPDRKIMINENILLKRKRGEIYNKDKNDNLAGNYDYMNLEDDKYLDVYVNTSNIDEIKTHRKYSNSNDYQNEFHSKFLNYFDIFILFVSFLYLIYFINIIIKFKILFSAIIITAIFYTSINFIFKNSCIKFNLMKINPKALEMINIITLLVIFSFGNISFFVEQEIFYFLHMSLFFNLFTLALLFIHSMKLIYHLNFDVEYSNELTERFL